MTSPSQPSQMSVARHSPPCPSFGKAGTHCAGKEDLSQGDRQANHVTGGSEQVHHTRLGLFPSSLSLLPGACSLFFQFEGRAATPTSTCGAPLLVLGDLNSLGLRSPAFENTRASVTLAMAARPLKWLFGDGCPPSSPLGSQSSSGKT